MYAAYHLLKGAGHIAVHREHLKVSVLAMGRLARLCAVGTFQILISTAAWIGLIRIIATFGSTVVAGYGIAMRIVIFALLPAFGLGATRRPPWLVSPSPATRIVPNAPSDGRPIQPRLPRRVRRGVRHAGTVDRGAFTAEPEVARVATQALRIIALGFPLYAFGMVMSQSFNGAGDTGPRPGSTCSCSGCSRFHSHTCWPTTRRCRIEAGFVAVTVAYCALALVSGWLFRRGRWKMKQV